MNKSPSHPWRLWLIGIIALALSTVMTVTLLRLQLSAPVSPAKENAYANVKTTAYTHTFRAARGQIYDRYGRLLIANTIRYDIEIQYSRWNRKTQNETLASLLSFCTEAGYIYADTLPLSPDGQAFSIDRNENTLQNRRLNQFLQSRKWADTIEPAVLFDNLRTHYGIPADWVAETARAVLGVRYDMDALSFSTLTPFVLFSDVSIEFAAVLSERAGQFPGVSAVTGYTRTVETEYAAHLLGITGLPSQAEYDALSGLGYRLTDRIGKFGAEQAFESYLRGIDGYEKVLVDTDGRIVAITESQTPEAGSHVFLTLDIRLQAAVEHALSSNIKRFIAEGIENPNQPQDVAGGAAVVLDIKTGDVLACASYPTFDLSRYNALFTQLSEDPLKPMLDRALSGVYSPGSVFKVIPAVAGLELGLITRDTLIEDTGIYRYYSDFQPACWIYTSARLTHGRINVIDALRVSCNVFFYDLSRQLTINSIAGYARMFGLGEYTGIELAQERKGVVASPVSKPIWVGGDVLAAAVGQSINQFTPIQLCNYIATVANGGTRYECHLLKYVSTYDHSTVLLSNQAVVAGKVDMSETTHQIVMQGLAEVTENGTAAPAFQNYPISVGGKTGSAQVPSGSSDGVFVAFAPFGDPEIAVVVIVEHGGSGNRIAQIARDIFDAYFQLDMSIS